jgi:carbonic anhydrase
VPANQIVGLLPGELFVHRNVANLVVHSDLNCLTVLHYAVEVLNIEHVIVCGHYGCGGVEAAVASSPLGLADNWLRYVKDLRERHRTVLDASPDRADRVDRLCELNVIEQSRNVCLTTVVQDAWKRGRTLAVHGWIYALRDGLLRDLQFTVTQAAEVEDAFRSAMGGLAARRLTA